MTHIPITFPTYNVRDYASVTVVVVCVYGGEVIFLSRKIFVCT